LTAAAGFPSPQAAKSAKLRVECAACGEGLDGDAFNLLLPHSAPPLAGGLRKKLTSIQRPQNGRRGHLDALGQQLCVARNAVSDVPQIALARPDSLRQLPEEVQGEALNRFH
jgi:hypothetical protein